MSLNSILSDFSRLSLKESSKNLLGHLGYESERFIPGLESTPDAFYSSFASGNEFNQDKALFSEWKSADLLFQITDEELAKTKSLFLDENNVRVRQLKSYVFIAIELKQDSYSRGKFSDITRQINRLFPMPVMVILKHGDRITIAVINRRNNKLDSSKEVLGKVTLIRDINFSTPHRGHLDILNSLSFSNLEHPQKKPIVDFDSLHEAWENIFNVELLNTRFYKELSNWYFWALPQVEFPSDLEPDNEKRRATGLIRLLTRLIFCWFLKEKNLIPDNLFNPNELNKVLRGFNPESESSSTFYQAILQNLFFATLNQRMDKDSNGKPYRGFATDEGFLKNRTTYDLNNLYRYENLFSVSQEEAISLFSDIPFLNGGLFECLDRTEDGTNKKLYLDGFSRNTKKRPHVPDRLFFDSGETADLSTAYGDTKRKAEHVSGLITILNRYKFTIVENTPIDQEIALDPELLGKVFENLLASYNEETKTTARKQTGSFYTPRPIVDYMVDESLKAHLTRSLVEKSRMQEPDARAGLDLLFAYTEKEHAFTPAEVATLIDAIDAIKILDPACGSGAFPMGILHKLVFILGKLDPKNEKWEQLRIDEAQKTTDADERRKKIAEIANNFEHNNDDYGRKLYLIENCLYGVDIQPIAIQITKLRFFISLVCDQTTSSNKRDNHGIQPLPNLETKFVSANTLIGIPKKFVHENDLNLTTDAINFLQKQLHSTRHKYFTAQLRRDKLALQKEDKRLRQKIAEELEKSYAEKDYANTITKLAKWNPFDPQKTADFFDMEWMFGDSVALGFDIVIGNPPYVFGKHLADSKKLYHENFELARGQYDLFWLFYERGLNYFLKKGGIHCFINSDSILSRDETTQFRRWLFEKTDNMSVSHVGQVFGGVGVSAVIILLHSTKTPLNQYEVVDYNNQLMCFGEKRIVKMTEVKKDPKLRLSCTPNQGIATSSILNNCSKFEDFFVISRGEELGKKNLTRIENKPTPEKHIGILAGEGVSRFCTTKVTHYAKKTDIKKSEKKYKSPKIVVVKTGHTFISSVDRNNLITIQSVYNLSPKSDLSAEFGCALLNCKLLNYLLKNMITGQKKLFPQITQSNIMEMPVPKVSRKQQDEVVELVNRIMLIRSKSGTSDTLSLEHQIDILIYSLYGLTSEEIAIVENSQLKKID